MNILKKFLVVSMLCFYAVACSNNNEVNVTDYYDINNCYVAKFINNEEFAVSLVFDDNDISHYERGYPILKKYGIPATFNVSPGYKDFTEVYLRGYLELQSIGCEIGAHGFYHIDLTTLSESELELHMCKKPIELISSYFGKRPVSVSLNNAQSNEQIRRLFEEYYFVSKHLFLTDIERGGLPYISSMTFDDIKLSIDRCKKDKLWGIIALHGIDDSGWNPITSSQLESVCKYLVEKKIKAGTTGEIGLYEYLYANTTLRVSYVSGEYAEIIPELPTIFNYPDDYDKIVSICIPTMDNDVLVINFDFRKDTKICISGKEVVLR